MGCQTISITRCRLNFASVMTEMSCLPNFAAVWQLTRINRGNSTFAYLRVLKPEDFVGWVK